MITFGPSGWRGIIAEDFTFTGVRAVSQAIGEHIRSQDSHAAERGVVIGYDTRFSRHLRRRSPVSWRPKGSRRFCADEIRRRPRWPPRFYGGGRRAA